MYNWIFNTFASTKYAIANSFDTIGNSDTGQLFTFFKRELYTLVFIHYIKKIIFYENGKHRYRYHHDYYQTKLCKTNYHP